MNFYINLPQIIQLLNIKFEDVMQVFETLLLLWYYLDSFFFFKKSLVTPIFSTFLLSLHNSSTTPVMFYDRSCKLRCLQGPRRSYGRNAVGSIQDFRECGTAVSLEIAPKEDSHYSVPTDCCRGEYGSSASATLFFQDDLGIYILLSNLLILPG